MDLTSGFVFFLYILAALCADRGPVWLVLILVGVGAIVDAVTVHGGERKAINTMGVNAEEKKTAPGGNDTRSGKSEKDAKTIYPSSLWRL